MSGQRMVPVAWAIMYLDIVANVYPHEDYARREFDRLNARYPEPSRRIIPLYTATASETNACDCAAHSELLQIHRICMDVANCPPVADGDALTVRYVKDLAALVNRSTAAAAQGNASSSDADSTEPASYAAYICVNLTGCETPRDCTEHSYCRSPHNAAAEQHKQETLTLAFQNEGCAASVAPAAAPHSPPENCTCKYYCGTLHETGCPAAAPATPSKLPKELVWYDAVGKRTVYLSCRYFIMACDYDELKTVAIEQERRIAELEREKAELKARIK